MNILICNWKDLAHPNAGGAEVYLHNVARAWLTAGHEVTLFSSSVDQHPENETIDGLKIVRRGSRYSVYREARKYYEALPRGAFDLVVDSVNTVPFRCARYIKDRTTIAIAYQVCREIWPYEIPQPVAALGRHILEPYWLRSLRDVQVITISKSSEISLREYGLRHVTTIPVGESEKPIDQCLSREERPTVIFIGRLAANKRPGDILEAYRYFRATVPDSALWMVGTGPLLKQLQQNSPPGVTFFGQVSQTEKYALLSRAHVLVAASVREGWGLTVSEAASVGTPSIAYDVAGLRDSIHATGGTVVDEDPKTMATALETHFKEPPEEFMPRPGGTVPWSEVASAILAVATSAR